MPQNEVKQKFRRITLFVCNSLHGFHSALPKIGAMAKEEPFLVPRWMRNLRRWATLLAAADLQRNVNNEEKFSKYAAMSAATNRPAEGFATILTCRSWKPTT